MKKVDREFHYSFNTLSIEESELLNQAHTLQENIANQLLLMEQALKEIPANKRSEWVLVDQYGLWGNSLHTVYVSFKLTWLFTAKGHWRRPSRALKMMGVPFIKVKRTPNGYEATADGFEVIHILGLKEI